MVRVERIGAGPEYALHMLVACAVRGTRRENVITVTPGATCMATDSLGTYSFRFERGSVLIGPGDVSSQRLDFELEGTGRREIIGMAPEEWRLLVRLNGCYVN